MNCGCCACLSAANAGSATPNRPGLSAISRRVGTHATFYERMIAGLSALDPLTGRAGALAGLTTREKSDASIAFLDAWATTADVLAFYQERFANEGYLRTATERRSVLELGRLVGYTLQPGVSATSYAAYIMDEKAVTTIPAGSKVQSAPLLPDEKPQVFETAEDLEARGEWNFLTPRMTRPREITMQTLSPPSFRFYIEGSEHSLSSGDALLFEFQTNAVAVAWIRDVEVDRAAKRTTVTFHRIAIANTGTATASSPPSSITTIVTSTVAQEEVEVRKDAVLEKPSVAPASRFQMAASYKDRFKESSDFRFQIAGELVPELRKIPTIFANLPRAADPELRGVWVLRNRTAIFGYNAPERIATLSGTETDPTVTFSSPVVDTTAEKPDRVFLELPDDAVDVGSWIVLLAGTQVLARKVRDALTMPRAAYGLSGKTSRLDLNLAWWGATSFADIRTTAVLTRSEPLTVAWEPITDPVGATDTVKTTTGGGGGTEQPAVTTTAIVHEKGKTIPLDRVVSGLTPGRWFIITGERVDLPGVKSAELAMIAAVEHNGLGGGEHGDDGDDSLYTNIIVAGDGLSYGYKRETVKIYGNVVKITHGESFTQILGNGDATQRLQTFTLQHAPLTWVPAVNPSGVTTTLQVRVHDVLVREVTSLAAAGPADRVYVTKTGDDAKTSVTFGTGENGARLPTGTDNVRAVYRKGLGRAGNVLAGQINVPLTRVAGVREVVNPIDASGGADRESRDQARGNVPLAVRALGRVVSVRDYEEFARTFAGIAKAMATIPKNRRDTVLLTIAGDGEMEVLESSDLYRALVEALRKYGNALQPLRVVNRTKILVTGSARVHVHPDYEWRNVAPKVRASLLDEFSFEKRRLMQPVFPSEVIAAIQRVEGVNWVDLDALRGVHTDQLFEEKLEPKLEPIVPPDAKFNSTEQKWFGAGLAYIPASLIDAFVLQEVPNA